MQFQIKEWESREDLSFLVQFLKLFELIKWQEINHRFIVYLDSNKKVKYLSISSCANNTMPKWIWNFRGNTCSFARFSTHSSVYVNNEEYWAVKLAWWFRTWVSYHVGPSTHSSICCVWARALLFFISLYRLQFLVPEPDSENGIKGFWNFWKLLGFNTVFFFS